MLRGFVILVVALLSSIGGAFAGALPAPATTSYEDVSETKFSIGLRFDFGDKSPEIVGAVRHTKTSTGNNVIGGLAEVALPLMTDTPFVPTVRIMGLAVAGALRTPCRRACERSDRPAASPS